MDGLPRCTNATCPTVGSREMLATHTAACADLHLDNTRLRDSLQDQARQLDASTALVAELEARHERRLHLLQRSSSDQAALRDMITQADADLVAEREGQALDRDRYRRRAQVAAQERAQELPELEERLANYQTLQIEQVNLAHEAEIERQRLEDRIVELEGLVGALANEGEGEGENAMPTPVASTGGSPVASGSGSGVTTRRRAATAAAGEEDGSRGRQRRRIGSGV